MSSTFWKSIFISPITLGIALLLASGAMAAPKGSVSANDQPDVATPTQVAANDVEAGADIKPSDWQYSALQGVAAKYGCNANLNNQPVSQLEFARGLNNCLGKVEPILAQNPSGVTAADLEVIKRLTQEFRAQLSEVDNRLTSTEKRIAQSQGNQFSTTTKLKGEAVFNITGAASGSDSSNTVFGDRVRLLFESSFNGQDRLWTRIVTGNQPGVNSNLKNGGTAEGTQVSEGIPFTNPNATGLDWLAYQFPLSTSTVYLAATGGIHVDYTPSYGGSFDDATGANGALSSFAESSPIYKIGGGAGVGATLPFSSTGLTSLNVGYLAGSANRPTNGAGLFNGDYAILAQANFKLGDKLDGGLTYVNSFHTGTNAIYGFGAGAVTGTGILNTGNPPAGSTLNGTTANSYGAGFLYKASDTLAFNGFVMNTVANRGGIGKQDIWSYGAGLSLPNIDGNGSLIGLLVGAEPYVGGVGTTPYHIEGFYKYKLSDNLSITPGLIYLTAPNQTAGNSALIGVVRTTFTF